MFQLATSNAINDSSMSMTAMRHSNQASATHANAATFYTGLLMLLIAATIAA